MIMTNYLIHQVIFMVQQTNQGAEHAPSTWLYIMFPFTRINPIKSIWDTTEYMRKRTPASLLHITLYYIFYDIIISLDTHPCIKVFFFFLSDYTFVSSCSLTNTICKIPTQISIKVIIFKKL